MLWGLFTFVLSAIGGVLSFLFMYYCFNKRINNSRSQNNQPVNPPNAAVQAQANPNNQPPNPPVPAAQAQANPPPAQQQNQQAPPAQQQNQQQQEEDQEENFYENIPDSSIIKRCVSTITAPVYRAMSKVRKPQGAIDRDQTELKQMADRQKPQPQHAVASTSFSGHPVQNKVTTTATVHTPPAPPTELQKVVQATKHAGKVVFSKYFYNLESDKKASWKSVNSQSLVNLDIESKKKKEPALIGKYYESLEEFMRLNPVQTWDNIPFPYIYQDWYDRQSPDRGASQAVLHPPQADTPPADDAEYMEPVPQPADPLPPPTTQAPPLPVSASIPLSSSGGRGARPKELQLPRARPTTRSVSKDRKGKNITPKAKLVTDRLTRFAGGKCSKKK